MKTRMQPPTGTEGSTMVPVLVMVAMLGGLGLATLDVSSSSKEELETEKDQMRALNLAESGVSECLAEISVSLIADTEPAEGFGSAKYPIGTRSGEYWATLTDNGDETWTVVSEGVSGQSRRRIEAILGRTGASIYDSALYAGNESEDPNYTLTLGGWGNQGDEVEGDVFSGGNVKVWGDADIDGEIRASGTISGAVGQEDANVAVPDIAGMNYEENHDFNVGELFEDEQYWSYDNAGGSGYQLPESSPAHIFRKNCTDRSSETSSTEKDDYFLEDPYENVRTDPNQNGKDAYKLTLSGTMGNPGPPGTGKVYYIDGNLWIHNKKTYSFKFYNSGDEATRVTIVVKGNIYFSDNIFYKNQNKDGVAFIAINDDDVEDSGNIYFGDPAFGTLEHMDSFMYAENNFYDNNLSASGSAEVTVRGNMTAGNHVAIERDWAGQHSKLTVEFDERISQGFLELPGLPGVENTAGVAVLSWREVAAQ